MVDTELPENLLFIYYIKTDSLKKNLGKNSDTFLLEIEVIIKEARYARTTGVSGFGGEGIPKMNYEISNTSQES